MLQATDDHDKSADTNDNDQDTSQQPEQSDADDDDRSQQSSESEGIQSSGDEYKQPESSSMEEDDIDEQDDDIETKSESNCPSEASEGASVHADLSSDLEDNRLDTSINFTEQEDAISRISDSLKDPDEHPEDDINVSSNEECDKVLGGPNNEEDPDKTLDYHPSDQSKSMDDTIEGDESKSMSRADDSIENQTPMESAPSCPEITKSSVSETTPNKSGNKPTVRQGKISQKRKRGKSQKLIVKITTPIKKKKNNTEPVTSESAKDKAETIIDSSPPTNTESPSTTKVNKSVTPTKNKPRSDTGSQINKNTTSSSTQPRNVNVSTGVHKSVHTTSQKDQDLSEKQSSTQKTKTIKPAVHLKKKTGAVATDYVDIPVVPFVDDFGDTSKPKEKSSSKLPCKSSKRKAKETTTIPPTPPRPSKTTTHTKSVTDDSHPKDMSKKSDKSQKKPHKNAKQALKTLSDFRKTVGTPLTGAERQPTPPPPPPPPAPQPPKKRQRIDKFSADYDDQGGAGPSNTSQTEKGTPKSAVTKKQVTPNPLSGNKKGPKAKSTTPLQPKGKVQKNTTTMDLEQQKVDVLKELSSKYTGTSAQTPIIFAPQMVSPTPSTQSVPGRSVEPEDEDELTMWGKLIVKKLRKFKDRKKMEDVQNYIHVLITDAERGEWSKPTNLIATPVPHNVHRNVLQQQVTPDRPHIIRHTIRSPMPKQPVGDRLVRAPDRRLTNVNENQPSDMPDHQPHQAEEHVNTSARPRPNIQHQVGDNFMSTSGVVGENLRLLNQQPEEFSYTWQGPSSALGQRSHQPHIYLNYNQYGRERQGEEDEQSSPQCSQRKFTNM